jgi:hypothetical protein
MMRTFGLFLGMILVIVSGCNDSTEPRITAVDLTATTAPSEPPGAIQLQTTLRNTGSARVVVQGRGLLIRFAVYDGSGNEVVYRSPCVTAVSDPAPVEVTLDPGEVYEHTVPIQGIRWETTPFMEWFTCESVPLETGEYRNETWTLYQTEGIDEYYTVHGAPVLVSWEGGVAP